MTIPGLRPTISTRFWRVLIVGRKPGIVNNTHLNFFINITAFPETGFFRRASIICNIALRFWQTAKANYFNSPRVFHGVSLLILRFHGIFIINYIINIGILADILNVRHMLWRNLRLLPTGVL